MNAALSNMSASAAEAETAGLFYNAQTAIPIRRLLTAIGHPQPPTPLKTDNSTALGFVYDNIHQRRSKSWDMRYWWLRDKVNQKQFNIFWQEGAKNNVDYFTKNHPTRHHIEWRPRYVLDNVRMPYVNLVRILTPLRV